ncbi:HAD family hydrolase [Actinoplanes sp. CA-030573]|uniref:HAD family hydrolase n=1 Tax=Actinoplanes sp. CA-030573 TaxID=3239898 RepID=UPI003D8E0CC0
MLLLIDLDNTLIDRRAAFKSWAESRFGESETPWLVEADKDGFEAREMLAARIVARYGGDAHEMLAELRAGMVAQMSPDPEIDAVLVEAADAGFVPFVVTNGTVAQQEAKLRRTGLDRLVAGWTISEGVGVRKPDPRIFEIAAAEAGRSWARTKPGKPGTGWMVGDSAAADVGGGVAAGLRTGWVSLKREWPADLAFRPDVTAATGAAVLREVIKASQGG